MTEEFAALEELDNIEPSSNIPVICMTYFPFSYIFLFMYSTSRLVAESNKVTVIQPRMMRMNYQKHNYTPSSVETRFYAFVRVE